MKRSFFVYALTLLVAAAATGGAAAQEPAVVSSNAFEVLRVLHPLTLTDNAASLTQYPVNRLSMVSAGLSLDNDEITLVQQPDRVTSFNALTRGLMNYRRLTMTGEFEYLNSYYQGVNYNGTLMFNTLNPYLLGDTVPSGQSMEQFRIRGAAGYMVSEALSVGVGADYLTAVGAKQKDPRNKNSITGLKLYPGVLYSTGNTILGVNGALYKSSNEVSYKVEGNWSQSLFAFLGLGYYRQEINITSYSMLYDSRGWGGSLQAAHHTDKIMIMASADYRHLKEEALRGNNYRLINGIAVVDEVTLTGLVRLAAERGHHLFSLKGSLQVLSGDEVLQRSYTVNKGNYSYDSLATVSWIKNKHMVTNAGGELRYTRLVTDAQYNIDLEAGAALYAGYLSAEHFPVQSYGYHNTLNGGVKIFFRKLFRSGRLMISPGAEAGYRMNLASDMAYTEQSTSATAMVYHDYYILKADMVNATATVRMELPLKGNKFVKSLFFIPKGRWAAAIGSEAGNLSAVMADIAAGFIF